VPVFRYALERWRPSPYALHVFHRGPLTAAQQACVKKLEQASATANIEVQVVDLGGPVSPPARKLWDRQPKDAVLPRLVVSAPDAAPVWSGGLDEKAVAELLDSPVRRQIVKHLAGGETAVWVLLRSGDRKADGAAVQLLERELARLGKEIHLPEQAEDDPLRRTSLPLKVAFTVIAVDRAQAGEGPFVRMLLGTEPGLDEMTGPIVFPIFGRGRALCGLEGKGLTGKEMETVARFLCGACSCQVKEMNPGVDLLLSADWEDLLDLEREGPEQPAPKVPDGVPASGRHTAGSKPAPWWLWSATGAGVVLVALSGAWVWRRSRG
jgi:hypothetical protein